MWRMSSLVGEPFPVCPSGLTRVVTRRMIAATAIMLTIRTSPPKCAPTHMGDCIADIVKIGTEAAANIQLGSQYAIEVVHHIIEND